MDLQCILCIANSSYTIKTLKDKGYFVFWCFNCDTYWNFYKKLKIWTCFRQNGRFQDQTGGQETTSQNGILPFKTGGLEHMLDECCMLHRAPMIEYNLEKICKTYPPRCPKNTFPEVFYIKLSKLASTHSHRLWHCYKFLCSIFVKAYRFHQTQRNLKISL